MEEIKIWIRNKIGEYKQEIVKLKGTKGVSRDLLLINQLIKVGARKRALTELNWFIDHLPPTSSTGLQKEVTGCKGCPMHCDDDKYGDQCYHPEFQDYVQTIDFKFFKEGVGSPDWCPLKKEPITISFKQQHNAKE